MIEILRVDLQHRPSRILEKSGGHISSPVESSTEPGPHSQVKLPCVLTQRPPEHAASPRAEHSSSSAHFIVNIFYTTKNIFRHKNTINTLAVGWPPGSWQCRGWCRWGRRTCSCPPCSCRGRRRTARGPARTRQYPDTVCTSRVDNVDSVDNVDILTSP